MKYEKPLIIFMALSDKNVLSESGDDYENYPPDWL